jgi:hypothetical protein
MPAQEQPHVYRLPFHETQGRIVLDVTVDGIHVPLLFDTGASMSFSLVRRGHPLVLVLHHDEPRFETAGPDERCPFLSVPEIRVEGLVGRINRLQAVFHSSKDFGPARRSRER